MHIVGGAYGEYCVEPQWNEFYGSGLRAVAAISSIDSKAKFSTYIDSKNKLLLEYKATAFDFELKEVSYREKVIFFSYFHPLSVPTLNGKVKPPPKKICISDDIILRFGMLEEEAVVHGNRVIYDPQSPICPKHFHDNGSTAKHLAIVLNNTEARMLSGENENQNIVSSLFEKSQAEVIIIKSGTFGCDVYESNGKHVHLAAIETPKVWSIGSGDIFSAFFAYFWGVEKQRPPFAASKAINATAFYSHTKSAKLPIRLKDINSFTKFPKVSLGGLNAEKPKKIYLASPFFTIHERWFIEETRRYLKSECIEVFSPFHDVGRGSADEIYDRDIDGLVKCDSVFANLCSLDSGTLFEIGYAIAIGKPVVVFSQNNKEEDLKMIEGAKCKIFDDYSTAIYHTIWETLKT